MNKDTGKTIQTVISYTVYVLSGFLILSPLHKSENIILSLFFSFVVSGIFLKMILRIFMSKSSSSKYTHYSIGKSLSVIASISSIFVTLMLITEIIKDVAYIANRGVSLIYYTFIAISILFVSFYLCTSSRKGIYRFLVLSSIIFSFLIIIMFFSLFSTKSVITNCFKDNSIKASAIITGLKSGAFFTLDSIVFLFCFNELISKRKDTISSGQVLCGFYISYAFIAVYSIFTVMIFGKLTPKISDADYALIKLIPSFDLTEIISAVRIVSFLIKSSCYIFVSAYCFKALFPKTKKTQRQLISLFYLSIPSTFLIFAFFDKTLEYGAFQHLIYPVNAIMSLCFIILCRFLQKKKE